ncbi:MAG: flavin reductase family protein [Alphaproteobacteria bacterium]
MSVDNQAFRRALGAFTTGVCIVTCPPREGNDPVALTVSSFASVSLEPPLVLWCIDKGSDRFSAFFEAEAYGVSVLGEGQDAVSMAFAGNGRLCDVTTQVAKTGAPLIDGAIAQLDCRIAARHDAGDHVILVGEVVHIVVSDERAPLVYHRGCYRQLAPDPDQRA